MTAAQRNWDANAASMARLTRQSSAPTALFALNSNTATSSCMSSLPTVCSRTVMFGSRLSGRTSSASDILAQSHGTPDTGKEGPLGSHLTPWPSDMLTSCPSHDLDSVASIAWRTQPPSPAFLQQVDSLLRPPCMRARSISRSSSKVFHPSTAPTTPKTAPGVPANPQVHIISPYRRQHSQLLRCPSSAPSSPSWALQDVSPRFLQDIDAMLQASQLQQVPELLESNSDPSTPDSHSPKVPRYTPSELRKFVLTRAVCLPELPAESSTVSICSAEGPQPPESLSTPLLSGITEHSSVDFEPMLSVNQNAAQLSAWPERHTAPAAPASRTLKSAFAEPVSDDDSNWDAVRTSGFSPFMRVSACRAVQQSSPSKTVVHMDSRSSSPFSYLALERPAGLRAIRTRPVSCPAYTRTREC